MNGNCTTRPDCPCAYCILLRTKPSASEEERQAAEAYILEFGRKRDIEMDAEARASGAWDLPLPLETVLNVFDFDLLYTL